MVCKKCAAIGTNSDAPGAHSPNCPNEQGLGLGDIVSLGWNDGYDNATVTQLHKDGTVDLFRVYVHANDFSCSGRQEGSLSILTYIGTETVRDISPSRLKLVRKNTTPIR